MSVDNKRMYIKIIIVLIVAASAIFVVQYFLTGPGNSLNDEVVTQLPIDLGPQGERSSGSILTKDNQVVPDAPLLENANTTELSEGFYKSTNDDETFGVYYNQDGGNLTVVLYGADTKTARTNAETYLKTTLGYTEAQLCSVDAMVITNEYENPALAGQLLGFSFCPGSVPLE